MPETKGPPEMIGLLFWQILLPVSVALQCDFCGIDTLYVTIITLLLPDEAPDSDFAGLPPAAPLLLGPISEHFSAIVKDSSKIFTLQHQKNTTDVEKLFSHRVFLFSFVFPKNQMQHNKK